MPWKTDEVGTESHMNGITLDKEYYYQNNTKLIASCDSTENWADNWWAGTVGTYRFKSDYFVLGDCAVRCLADIINSGIHYEFSSDLDLTTFNNSNFASTTDDYICWSLYISQANIDRMDAGSVLTIALFCDAYLTLTNYYYYSVDKAILTDGWNHFKVAKSSFTSVGTPSWSTIKGISTAYWDATTAPTSAMSYNLDAVFMCRKDPSSAAPNPFQRAVNNVWTRDFAINYGQWYVGLNYDQLICRNLDPDYDLQTIKGTQLFNVDSAKGYGGFDIQTTFNIITTSTYFGISWYIDSSNCIQVYYTGTTIIIQQALSGVETNNCVTLSTLSPGDTVDIRLNKSGRTSHVTVFLNNDYNTPYCAALDTPITGNGYLAIMNWGGLNDIINLSMTKFSHEVPMASRAKQSMDCDTLLPAMATIVARNWTVYDAAEDNDWQDVAWSPGLGLFAAVSTDGAHQVMTSPNGKNWTVRNAASNEIWRSICWSPELTLFCAVASTGNLTSAMTSPDGTNWTTRVPAAANSWTSICWSRELNLFCAVSNDGVGTRAMTSPNGTDWTIRTTAANNEWVSICWAPELMLFVAVSMTGSGNRVMTSQDGTTWVSRTSAADHNWVTVTWSPHLRLLVAGAEDASGTDIMTSPDGIVWTSRTTATNLSFGNICWSPELKMFMATGYDNSNAISIHSFDGINWIKGIEIQASTYWQSICWSAELGNFVSVCEDYAMRSLSYK